MNIGPHCKFAEKLTASSKTSRYVVSGRYELEFSVTDKSQGQRDVAANVSVQVRSLQPNHVHYLTPLTVDASSETLLRQRSEVRGKEKQQLTVS